MKEGWETVRITDKATHTVISQTSVLGYVIVSVANAGTGWTLVIQDKAGTPLVLISFTLAMSSDGQPVIINLRDFPVPMTGGIDIITGGTTPGEVVVRMYIATN